MGARGYIELLRPANVVTSLADVLAGCAVVSGTSRAALTPLLMSTACLYAGGIVLNDYFDRDTDARERPERPIPSGRVRAPKAAILGVVLLAAGVAIARLLGTTSGFTAGAVAALALLYDTVAKKHPLLGPMTMGACRGANLLLGMTAVPVLMSARWPIAILPFVYITAVTALSRGEVHGSRRPIAGAALAGIIGVILAVAVLAAQALMPVVAVALAGVLAYRVVPPFAHAYRRPEAATIRRAIRAGVLSLVLLDAAIAATHDRLLVAAAIVMLGLCASALARAVAVT
jgi:4-hydroxybenzoate polyprenyltransferase